MKTYVEAIEQAMDAVQQHFVSLKEQYQTAENNETVDDLELGLIWIARKVEKLKAEVSQSR